MASIFFTKNNTPMIKAVYMLIVLLPLLVACGGASQKSEIERLKAENNQLQNAKATLEQEVNDYFSTMNEIQTNIEKIKNARRVITVDPLSENTPQSVRDKVTQDMVYLNELIQTNQNELDNLRARLKRSAFKLDDLEKNLTQLTLQLNEESAKVLQLQKQLHLKDSLIAQLGTKVDSLGKNVEELALQNEEKQNLIQQQISTIHAAWYAIGSRKELKDNKILTSDGIFSTQKVLQSDFNKNYFVKIDAREIRTIPLYTSAKARVLTTHPKESYTIAKEKANYVLTITNPSEFWSISKYLVIEID